MATTYMYRNIRDGVISGLIAAALIWAGGWILAKLNPQSLTYLASLLVPLWVVALSVGFVVAFSAIALIYWSQSRKEKSSSPVTQAEITPAHFQLLRFRPTWKEEATYKAKIWVVLRNGSPGNLNVTQLRWNAGNEEVQIQPPLRYLFKVESQPGAWQSDSWSREAPTVTVPQGWCFEFWLGVNPAYTAEQLKHHYGLHKVGKATLTVRLGDTGPTQEVTIPI